MYFLCSDNQSSVEKCPRVQSSSQHSPALNNAELVLTPPPEKGPILLEFPVEMDVGNIPPTPTSPAPKPPEGSKYIYIQHFHLSNGFPCQ